MLYRSRLHRRGPNRLERITAEELEEATAEVDPRPTSGATDHPAAKSQSRGVASARVPGHYAKHVQVADWMGIGPGWPMAV